MIYDTTWISKNLRTVNIRVLRMVIELGGIGWFTMLLDDTT